MNVKHPGVRVFSKLVFAGLSIAVLSLSLYGCAKKAPSSGKVVAAVNGKQITVKKFEMEMAKLPPQLQEYIKTKDGEKRLLKSMVDREVLVNEAIKKGVNKSSDYKDQVSDFEKGLLVQLLLQKELVNKVNISESAARSYYKKHYLSFNLPSKVNVSYIQVNSMKEAQSVLDMLGKGVSFSSLAGKYSNAANAKKGGELGWIKFGQTTPAFNNAAFSISKVGAYSGIVKVGSHFDIIKLNKIVAGKAKSFSSVKKQIMFIMKQKEGSDFVKNYVANLKKKSNIKYFYNNLPSFGTEPVIKNSSKTANIGSEKKK